MAETYQCLSNVCKQVWRDYTGPVTCPICGHIYVKWVSYEQDMPQHSDLGERSEHADSTDVAL